MHTNAFLAKRQTKKLKPGLSCISLKLKLLTEILLLQEAGYNGRWHKVKPYLTENCLVSRKRGFIAMLTKGEFRFAYRLPAAYLINRSCWPCIRQGSYLSSDNGQLCSIIMSAFFCDNLGQDNWSNINRINMGAQFRRRTFHEPNLIPWIKYMNSSASESVKNGYLNLERLSRSFRLAYAGISPFITVLFQTPNFSCAEPNA